MATNEPDLCPLGTPATPVLTLNFTTNNTEWYPLNGDNNMGYSFVITDSGQTYTFSASLRPVLSTCATLYVPSGRTNVTLNVQSGDEACSNLG
jgi:hypothetical protein